VARLFTRLINEEEASDLYKLVTMEELKMVLSLFKKDKSPGPDGWTVEFFIHFFELLSLDLLVMVEETRSSGHIAGSLNSTFLSLIPKVNKPGYFGDLDLFLCVILFINSYPKLLLSGSN